MYDEMYGPSENHDRKQAKKTGREAECDRNRNNMAADRWHRIGLGYEDRYSGKLLEGVTLGTDR